MSELAALHVRVAYHEAGHAVAAWLLDKPIVDIMLPSAEGHHGGVQADYTTVGKLPGEQYSRYAEDAESLWYAAGPAAERVQFGQADSDAEANDEQPVHPRERLADIRDLVKTMLAEHWSAVEMLAGMLMCPPVQMTGSEAEAVIESALANVSWTVDDKLRAVQTVMHWRKSVRG